MRSQSLTIQRLSLPIFEKGKIYTHAHFAKSYFNVPAHTEVQYFKVLYNILPSCAQHVSHVHIYEFMHFFLKIKNLSKLAQLFLAVELKSGIALWPFRQNHR